jgi:hypothetical protein
VKNFLGAAVDNMLSRIYLGAAGCLLGWAAWMHLGPGFPETSMPEIALAAWLLPCSVPAVFVYSMLPGLPSQAAPVVLWSLFVAAALGNALFLGLAVRLVRRLWRLA